MTNREVIYEVHVRGFSMLNKNIVKSKRGKYAALCSTWALKHYKKLGITTIQLMPIMLNDMNNKGSYWGYSATDLFTLNPTYGTKKSLINTIKTLQSKGFKVICDYVANHSDGEIKGLEYDTVDRYGCGSPIMINSPKSLPVIKKSLSYFLDDLGFNGLRFDLAACLLRMPDGSLNSNSPILEWLEENYSETKLFTGECYDLHGNYRWQFPKWIKRISNSIRDQIRDQQQYIYTKEAEPLDNVGFLTCHDGNVLLDNCSFKGKYNLLNGEGNIDGSDNNKADNCSIEGLTDDSTVLHWRQARADSMLNALQNYTGNVMLLQGDVDVNEQGRWIGRMTNTQYGNNNVYAQNNPLGWVVWDKLDKKGYEDLYNEYFK